MLLLRLPLLQLPVTALGSQNRVQKDQRREPSSSSMATRQRIRWQQQDPRMLPCHITITTTIIMPLCLTIHTRIIALHRKKA